MNTCLRFECRKCLNLGGGYMQCGESHAISCEYMCSSCEVRKNNKIECAYCKKSPCNKKPKYLVYD